MDAGRFDALARALTSGASRRRLLQTLPGLAVGSILPWSSVARALDAGNEPVAPPAGGDVRACTGGADCATGEICLNGFCQTAAGVTTTGAGDAISCPTAAPIDSGAGQAPAASGRGATGQDSTATATAGQTPAAASSGAATGQDPTATAVAGQSPAAPGQTPVAAADGTAPTPTPTAVADDLDADAAGASVPDAQTPTSQADDQDGGPAEPTPRTITTPAGQGGQISTPVATTAAVAEIPPDQPLAAQIHDGVCGSLGDTPEFPLIDLGIGEGSAATPVANDGILGAESAIPARLSMTIVDTTIADLLANPFAIDVRLTVDDPETSIACGEIGALAVPSGANPQVAVGLATRNGSGFAGIASLLEQNGRTVVTVFVAPGLAGGTTAEFAAGDPTDRVTAPASPFAAGATAALTEAVDLRSAPRGDAAVVGELAEGATVTVTAAAVDGWVPVRDQETDRPGYVEAESLKVAD